MSAVACPVCDQLALAHAGAGETCSVCGWEDVAQARTDAAEPVGAGGVSLTEARRAYAEFGEAYPPSEVGGS